MASQGSAHQYLLVVKTKLLSRQHLITLIESGLKVEGKEGAHGDKVYVYATSLEEARNLTESLKGVPVLVYLWIGDWKTAVIVK